MRTILATLCVLFATVVMATDFTLVERPNPKETPLPVPTDELRAEWTIGLPSFPLIQAPDWHLSLVAGRPQTVALPKNERSLAISPGKSRWVLPEPPEDVFLRDSEKCLRVLPLPPRPVGYPANALVCLGVSMDTIHIPGFSHQDIDSRALLPFRLDALLGHRAAKLRNRAPSSLPSPTHYIRAQLRLAPKALNLPDDAPADTIHEILRERRDEFDPPLLPDGLFAVSRQGEDRLILSFSNITDTPLTIHTLPHVGCATERPSHFRGSIDSDYEIDELDLATPFTLAPGERRDLPFRMVGEAKPGVTSTLTFSEPVMLNGELRTLRLPPITIQNRWVKALLPRFDGAILTLTQTLPPNTRPADGDCPLSLSFADASPFKQIGALALTNKAKAPLRVESTQETLSIDGLPDAGINLDGLSQRISPNASHTIAPWTAPCAAALTQPQTLACRLYVLAEDNTYWPLNAERTYPAANPNEVRNALREVTAYRKQPPDTPFSPDTPAVLTFAKASLDDSDDALPSIDPAWMRLTLDGNHRLALTIANPSAAPLTLNAGSFVLWASQDVFCLDGKLLRNPSNFSASGDTLFIPQVTIAPNETKTFHWRLNAPTPNARDSLLYVEAPLLIGDKRTCVLRAEFPLRGILEGCILKDMESSPIEVQRPERPQGKYIKITHET